MGRVGSRFFSPQEHIIHSCQIVSFAVLCGPALFEMKYVSNEDFLKKIALYGAASFIYFHEIVITLISLFDFECFSRLRNRYLSFVKSAAFQFQQLRLKKMKEEQEAEQVGGE